jgi:hypothetical protein
MPTAQSYLRNNKSSEVKRLRCFPSCNPVGHKAQGFCGSIIKAVISSRVAYTDQDIRDGKLIVVGELCEVSQTGQPMNSVVEGWRDDGISISTLKKHTDWHSPDFRLFPGSITKIKSGGHPKSYSYAIEFQPSSWPYGWKGSRHKAPKHAFVIHVLSRIGNVAIRPPKQALGARTIKHNPTPDTPEGIIASPPSVAIPSTNPADNVMFQMLFQLRSKIFEVNCCRRAGGPMMLNKWADAVRARQVVPVAATNNLAKENMLVEALTPKAASTKKSRTKSSASKSVKSGVRAGNVYEQARRNAVEAQRRATEAFAGADALTMLSASKPVLHGAFADDLSSSSGSRGSSPVKATGSAPTSSLSMVGSPQKTVKGSPAASTSTEVHTPLMETLTYTEKVTATGALSFLSPRQVKKEQQAASSSRSSSDDALLLFGLSSSAKSTRAMTGTTAIATATVVASSSSSSSAAVVKAGGDLRSALDQETGEEDAGPKRKRTRTQLAE